MANPPNRSPAPDPWADLKKQYGDYEIATADADDASVAAVSSGIWQPLVVGDNVLRFLPALPGKPSPFRVTAVHYVEPLPGTDRKLVFCCPRVELKQPCVVCQKSEELARSGNPIDRANAGKMSAGLRIYANVIDRNSPQAGVRVTTLGRMIYEQLKAIRRNTRLGGDFTDPGPKGFDIIIQREGTGPTDTRYTVHPDRNCSPLAPTPEEALDILGMAHDLDALVDTVVPEALLQAWGEVARAHVAGRQERGRAMLEAGAPGKPGTGVGAGLMGGRKPAGRAVSDARKVPDEHAQEVPADDDFDTDFPPK